LERRTWCIVGAALCAGYLVQDLKPHLVLVDAVLPLTVFSRAETGADSSSEGLCLVPVCAQKIPGKFSGTTYTVIPCFWCKICYRSLSLSLLGYRNRRVWQERGPFSSRGLC
ncbi:unnamed protein product, partial [Ectocarpus fasciculatus]